MKKSRSMIKLHKMSRPQKHITQSVSHTMLNATDNLAQTEQKGHKPKVSINIKSTGNGNLTLVLKTEERVSKRKQRNDDLRDLWDPPRLPKIKSTIYSQPKFLSKSNLNMLNI